MNELIRVICEEENRERVLVCNCDVMTNLEVSQEMKQALEEGLAGV